jgi:RNA polymerase sigma-70 factor (ECF subfamily)
MLACAGAQATTCCLLPPGVDEGVLALFRRHFDGPGVRVLVEQRHRERRRRADRRWPCQEREPRRERRWVNNPSGRRVADRRAGMKPVPVPILPTVFGPVSARVRFAERLPAEPNAVQDVEAARLVIRYQTGEREPAFAALYELYAPRIQRFAYTALRDEHEAEDLCQQVFMRVGRALAKFRLGEAPFRAWLFKIARNCVLDASRSTGRIQLLEPAALAKLADIGGTGAGDKAVDWISRPDIRALVDRLPRSQREVLALRYVLDCDHAEVAQLLGRTIGSVRQSHHLALRMLEKNLRAGDEPATGARCEPRRRFAQPMTVVAMPYRFAAAGFSLLRRAA